MAKGSGATAPAPVWRRAGPENGWKEPAHRISTGIAGLDDVLHGGLIPGRAYLLRGGPGSGKTTVGLHFLTAGSAQGEHVLFISVAEPEEQVRHDAETLGLEMRGVTFLDLSPSADFFAQTQTYDIFSPAEVEREPTTRKIVEEIETLRPHRVFLDGMTQFRYLTADPFQFRKEVLSFLRFVVEHGATALFTSEESDSTPDDDLQFMADGVITLHASPEGRTLEVTKFRGSDYLQGPQSMRLGAHGVDVFPRLLPETHKPEFPSGTISSGVPELDCLLHGGLEKGTVTIISGPSGVGKTTLGLQFMMAAAESGEHSLAYMFEESTESVLRRCEAVGIPARGMVERGLLTIAPVEPLELAPDEFTHRVLRETREHSARVVTIDSIAGYELSLKGEDPAIRLHTLSRCLQNNGVTVLLVNEVDAITGELRTPGGGMSYVADNILFLRYIEMAGSIRKIVGVLKKRLSGFERTMREIEITPQGIRVGAPLTQLRGILQGVPEWSGGPRARRASHGT